MSTLIITIPGDAHAHAVGWALDRLGEPHARWFPSDLETTTATTQLSSAGIDVALRGPDGDIATDSLRTVWLRRFRAPTAGPEYAPGDRLVAERESSSFLRGLTSAISRRALWANAPAAQRHASLKTPQLVAAHDAGLSIPRTVMTNDMEAVRRLWRTCEGRMIHKGFYPAVWRGNGRDIVLQTTRVTAEDLEAADALRLSPGIFQELVPKRAELRVMLFGRTCIAAEITEQDEIDWRTTHAMRLAPYRLPESVEAQLFATLDALGLSMGIADLIVTPDGEYVFLEINEQGQFLWVEGRNPEIAVLEPFARFLASGDPAFRWTGTPSIHFDAYCASEAAAAFAAGELQRRDHGGVIVPDGSHESTKES